MQTANEEPGMTLGNSSHRGRYMPGAFAPWLVLAAFGARALVPRGGGGLGGDPKPGGCRAVGVLDRLPDTDSLHAKNRI